MTDSPAKALRSQAAGVDVVDLADEMQSRLREWCTRTSTSTVVTGLGSWDRFIRLARGRFGVLGAEQGSGKSTLGLQVCLGAAANGTPCVYVSCEDGPRLVSGRLLAMLAKADLQDFLYGSKATPTDSARGSHAVAAMRRLPMLGMFSRDYSATLKLLSLLPAGSLIVVDYLQALVGAKGQDRRNEVRVMVQKLAERSRAEDHCLLLLSQLTRPQSRVQGEEPSRHWLKEASDICDAADFIGLMWRDQSDPSAPTHLKVDKDKDGFTGARWEMRKNPEHEWLVEVPR